MCGCLAFLNVVNSHIMEFSQMNTRSRFSEDKVSEGRTMPFGQYCSYSRFIPQIIMLTAHHRITSLFGLVVLLLVVVV